MSKDETTKPKDFSKKVEEPKEKPKDKIPPGRETVASSIVTVTNDEAKKRLVEEQKKPPEKPIKDIIEEEMKEKKVQEVVTLDDPTSYARLVRMERMVEYLVVSQIDNAQKILPEPDIRDIVHEIAAKHPRSIKEKKKDEVPPTT